MSSDICGSATAPDGGQPRLCPLRAALAAHPCVESCDEFCRVALSLFRFIGAAYTTGASDCWEAAYRFADEAPGVSDSPLLVARAAALVRILRSGRPCELCFMPPSCRRLSKDEAGLMQLLAVARRTQPGELESIVCQLVGSGKEDAATRAVNALALC
ncbi:hypothetical protein C7U92_30025 [Bradyrhizobium sp. WBOS7]|uniref:Uncharacterized protein n=1 Tax=Bradyrhizobium betae TaxID=244734 RepID=A0AAE9N8C1_9BRAD|nr:MULTISPECIES: hypothetical protein [Bradyrhizobium]MDD1574975.1 hypothetical protein [Bradyrhizobium sp. WBOS1]UUO33384.1 hypothetical protein DCK84_01490 [Bradyrhizobium sp. WBOS01]MDD1531677.1 hypothetical protein [Bradyrhizobium sp. WBOS2]MDD1580925.1 hypothetical protein [Bradyrhizobium sp. WBOS7]MDD1604887.1 hypothetical protein [Bradyrhizobium sp. WBOS16]